MNDDEDFKMEQYSAACPFRRTESGIVLKNYITKEELTDTLHLKSKGVKCNKACVGALMQGQSTAPGFRTKKEVWSEAYPFLKEYYTYAKIGDPEFQKRLDQVEREIKETGTYELQDKELEFGGKLAWRNASRCSGRIHWKTLEVQDCRWITSTTDMFQALCTQLYYATNCGNIRSTMTIFPQRIPGRDDFRIWNPQLINFAGYMNDDGSVVGDPGRLHLTRLCQKLGWKGKGGEFDILPWILSAPEEGPKLYEIPEELVLMVNIEHPKYQWFLEMGWKWYALPAVSDMMLDVGGVSFTAVSFNGWYQDTEIGSRNLCDPQRYNIRKSVAEKMGMDTSTHTSLWKNFAETNVNLAVLYSFEKNGVTMVDHHTASDSFVRHHQQEHKLRGGCPADWTWIVPPGATTSVFHLEMLNYVLKPTFDYQEPAWINYKWPETQPKVTCSNLDKDPGQIKNLQTPTPRVPATILFASETGKSETFAKRLKEVLKNSFKTTVKCMEDYTATGLKAETFVIMIASTFGNGEPPTNGKDFWRSLQRMKAENISLMNVEYAVFGLGSSLYKKFCNFAVDLDGCMYDMGARRILSLEKGDELKGQEDAFRMWTPKLYDATCKVFKVQTTKTITPEFGVWKRGSFSFVSSKRNGHLLKDLSVVHKKELLTLKMLSKNTLKDKHSDDQQTLLIRFKAEDASRLNYKPGDHIAIFPSNAEKIVDYIVKRCKINYDGPLQTEYFKDGTWISYDRLPPGSLRTYLSWFLDTSFPSRGFLKCLSAMATDKTDADNLATISDVTEIYEEWKNFRCHHLAELLREFPTVELDPTLLVSELLLQQPRYYSISSNPIAAPGEIDIAVSLVSYKTKDDSESEHFGVCSTFLKNLNIDEKVMCFIRSAKNFHLPKYFRDPIIMVAIGVGISPFRSFWKEREVEIKKNEDNSARAGMSGLMYLFLGFRNSSIVPYKQELADMMAKGVINNIFTAFSREPGSEKQYVQDKVEEQSSLILPVLTGRGHIYVCGSSQMAENVRTTVRDILYHNGNETTITELLESGRYHEDVFNVSHRRKI